MLKITLHDSASEFRLKLEGRLSGPWVGELRQCWQTAQSTIHNRKAILDLADLDFVDSDGVSLFEEMYRHGVKLAAMSPLIRSIVDDICHSCRCTTATDATKA